eukprot:scaffold12893_cov94-Isochrysis_galbana.AAC.3
MWQLPTAGRTRRAGLTKKGHRGVPPRPGNQQGNKPPPTRPALPGARVSPCMAAVLCCRLPPQGHLHHHRAQRALGGGGGVLQANLRLGRRERCRCPDHFSRGADARHASGAEEGELVDRETHRVSTRNRGEEGRGARRRGLSARRAGRRLGGRLRGAAARRAPFIPPCRPRRLCRPERLQKAFGRRLPRHRRRRGSGVLAVDCVSSTAGSFASAGPSACRKSLAVGCFAGGARTCASATPPAGPAEAAGRFSDAATDDRKDDAVGCLAGGEGGALIGIGAEGSDERNDAALPRCSCNSGGVEAGAGAVADVVGRLLSAATAFGSPGSEDRKDADDWRPRGAIQSPTHTDRPQHPCNIIPPILSNPSPDVTARPRGRPGPLPCMPCCRRGRWSWSSPTRQVVGCSVATRPRARRSRTRTR